MWAKMRCQKVGKDERHCLPYKTQKGSRRKKFGLIVKASRVLHETVGVFSDPEHGVAMRTVETAARRVAS